MPETLQVIAQARPSATTLTTAYTVPASTSGVISSIIVCNTSASAETFRIAVSPSGASISNVHYIYYDISLSAGSSYAIVLGLTFATTDVFRVYSSGGNLNFHFYGTLVT